MHRLVALAFLLLASCSTASPDAERRSVPPRAVEPGAAQPAAAPAPAAAPFGPLSEEQFKALHHPPAGTTISPRGTMIDLAGGKAYLSLPEGSGPFPGITVIHEWWGLNDNVKLATDRLAALGYAAVAVDLYGGVVATDADTAMKAMQAVDQDKATATLLAAHRFLKEDPRIRAPKRGAIGWCFGGAQALNLAMAAPDLDACVIYYGRLVTDEAEIAKIKAAVLGIFGTQDESIPKATIDAFQAALGKAGIRHDVMMFDAPHAFANPSGPRYDQEDAALAWTVTENFLRSTLKSAT